MNHGPIDLILQIDGDPQAVNGGRDRVWTRFQTVLDELVAELPRLRSGRREDWENLKGPVARRMAAAVSHAQVFITPMAAVAGAVADEMLQAFEDRPGIRKAIINNGGDIALYLAEGEACRVGVVANPLTAVVAGNFIVSASDNIRGLATSGWRGRSQSLGIADAVTVVGQSAAVADANATLVANSVDLPNNAKVRRLPAQQVKFDSDLGELLVVVGVEALSEEEAMAALNRGAEEARRLKADGHFRAAVLCLDGNVVVVDEGCPLQLCA